MIMNIHVKLGFIAQMREMQNAELRMQNCGIFFENVFKQSPKATQSFCILHSSFCIGQRKLSDKLKFDQNLRRTALWLKSHLPFYPLIL